MTHENRFSSGTPLAATANQGSLNEPEAQAGNTLLVPQMELRVKVAELRGYTWGKPVFDHDQKWHVRLGNPPFEFDSRWAGEPPPFDQCVKDLYSVPDYPNDLNACAEFTKGMTPEQLHAYGKHLGEVTGVMHWWDGYISGLGMVQYADATAEQRCRAFIATMEEKQ